jgi:subtilase family serine protease
MHKHSPVVALEYVKRMTRTIAGLVAMLVALAAIPSIAMAQVVKMRGTVPPGAATMVSQGHLDPAKTLTLDIRFALRNRADLDQLIADQINPASPQYHQWITADEFTRRFGVSTADFAAVKDWLTASGFQILGGSPEEGYLRFAIDTASAERVFNTQLEDFGSGRFANLTEPEIPARFAGVVGDILGMQNLGSLEPDYATSKLKRSPRKLPVLERDGHGGGSGPDFSLETIGGSGFAFGPPDFFTFYDETPLLEAGNTGANGSDCIGIFANTNIFAEASPATILKNYFGLFSLSDPIVTIDFSKETNPGVIGDGADTEAYLDIEAAHLIAPGAPITLYVTNPDKLAFSQNLTDAITAMTTENKCAALNFSYHICGASNSFFTTTLGDLFSRAQTQGQSVFVSAGDHGADTCQTGLPNVNELGANPLTTSVGGTQVNFATFDSNGFSTGYSTESSWNDQNGNASLAGKNRVSGGGISSIFTKPSWQQGVAGTSNDNFRDLPDVASLAGNPDIIVFADTDVDGIATPSQSDVLVIGTSLAAPLWTGYSRLLQTANGGHRLGSLNPIIWQLGVAGQAAHGFHDITSGDNTYISVVSGKGDVTVQGYSAGPGYDLVTGWGSIDADAFITAYLDAPTPPVFSKLEASPGSLNFGTSIADTASKPKTLTLENGAGKGSPSITLKSFAMTSNLTRSGGTCTTGMSLAPKGKCTMAFTMTPVTVGTNPGSVEISSNSSVGVVTVDASVTGKAPKVKK